jgi:hypothetical protein
MSSKLTDLPEVTAPGDDDVVYLVADPAGTHTSSKIKVSNLRGAGGNNPSLARVSRSTDQSIANTTEVPLAFDTVVFDDEGLHSVVSGASRFTIPSSGTYEAKAALKWASSPTGTIVGAWFRVNGTDYYGAVSNAPTSPEFEVETGPIQLDAGDYIEIIAWHDAGSAKNVIHVGPWSPWMTIQRLVGVRAPGDPTISRAHRTTDQAVVTGTEVGLSCNVVDFDDDALHSVVSSVSRFTIQRQGTYEFTGELVYDYHASGVRDSFFKVNATDYRGVVQLPPTPSPDWMYVQVTTGPLELNVDDYVELYAFQNSGATVNLKADSAASSPWMACKRVDAISAAVSFVGASAWKNYPVNQSIASGGGRTPIVFDDGDSAWWSAGAPTRLTVPSGAEGWYIISGRYNWQGGGTSNRRVDLDVNGGYLITDERQAISTDATHGTQAQPHYLAVGDYVEMSAFNSSAGAINILGAPNWTRLSLWRVGV